MRLDIFAIIPVAPKVIIKAVPPWLTNKSGIPDNGIIPSIDEIFINDSISISIAIPIAISPPNIFSDITDILIEQTEDAMNSDLN